MRAAEACRRDNDSISGSTLGLGFIPIGPEVVPFMVYI